MSSHLQEFPYKLKLQSNKLSDTEKRNLILQQLINVHGDKYDYSKLEYAKGNGKVTVICKVHGEFVTALKHHKSGSGCPKCAKLNSGASQRKSKETYLKQLINLYGDTYDLSKVEYKNKYSPVTLVCKTHGEFSQQAVNLLKGKGCGKCQRKILADEGVINSGFGRSRWIKMCNRKQIEPTFYLLKIFNEEEVFYKVGITSETIQERFRRLPYSYEVIYKISGNALLVYETELLMKRLIKKVAYTPKLEFGGATECFSIDDTTPLILSKQAIATNFLKSITNIHNYAN